MNHLLLLPMVKKSIVGDDVDAMCAKCRNELTTEHIRKASLMPKAPEPEPEPEPEPAPATTVLQKANKDKTGKKKKRVRRTSLNKAPDLPPCAASQGGGDQDRRIAGFIAIRSMIQLVQSRDLFDAPRSVSIVAILACVRGAVPGMQGTITASVSSYTCLRINLA